MKIYKKLAGQTIIYGMGTMIPRLLNFVILTPYFTRLFKYNIVEYGKVTELYAYVAFLMIVLTYGMETTFFRFINTEKDKRAVFSTIQSALSFTSIVFFIFVFLFTDPIARGLKFQGESFFIRLLAGILAVESISAIPFAKLRIEEKAKTFAILKIVQIVLNIGLMFSIYNIIPKFTGSSDYLLNINNNTSAKFIFISNLVASSFILLLLIPQFKDYNLKYVKLKLLRPLMLYGLPLMISGLAGTINETLDRSIYKQIIPDTNTALYELGIYGANYKIASFVYIFIQMFRYAAEPFYFNYAKEKNAKTEFANIMNIFVAIISTLGLTILIFIDYVKYFISSTFHEGLFVVPYIVLAYIFYGILFNLSIWYKLTNRTKYAFLIMSAGASLTIIINIVFVPVYHYKASAIAHVIAYFIMVLISYFLGKKYYPIKYNLPRLFSYLALGSILFLLSKFIGSEIILLDLFLKSILLIIFISFIVWKENLIRIIKR